MGSGLAYSSADVCPGCKDFVDGTSITYSLFLGDGVPDEESLVWAFKSGVHLHDVTVMRRGQEAIKPTLKREVRRLALHARRRVVRAWGLTERVCVALVERA